MKDFNLEEEMQVESDRKGPGLLIDEIHAAIKEIKKMEKLRVWMIFQLNF